MSARGYLRLETRGRKTSLPHPVELRFVRVKNSFFVIPGRSDSDWYLNALAAGSAKVRLGDLIFETTVRPASDSESREAMALFSAKYGERIIHGWYQASGACLCLSPAGPPTRRGAVLGESGATSTLEEWAAKGSDYYGDVASAFDSASEEYDFTINRNFINTWIRGRSISVLRRYVTPQDLLLEIGCGTGAEALEVSKYVGGIIATDISRSMIDLLTLKVRARRLTRKITPMMLRASEVSGVRDLAGGRRIRVAYSFNGALNCEPKIERFVEGLHSLLEPSGFFVCSVRNTVCVSEMVSHALVLQFDKATPRKKQPIMVSVGGRDIPSTYFSPRRFASFFTPLFKLKEMIGLPSILPPAYLNDYYLKLRTFIPVLEKLDSALSGRFPLNRLGDQTLFVFQRETRGGAEA